MPATLSPKPGDVVLRGTRRGQFELVDAITDRHIAGPVQLSRAVQLAKAHGAVGVWQQIVDDRGRPLGPLARFVIN